MVTTSEGINVNHHAEILQIALVFVLETLISLSSTGYTGT
jgi:hypothetical protein